MRPRELDHIVLNVTDVERSLAWYTGLLGLEGDRVDEWRAGEVPFPSVRVSEGCIFDLFADEESARSSLFNDVGAPKLNVAVLFDGSVSGDCP